MTHIENRRPSMSSSILKTTTVVDSFLNQTLAARDIGTLDDGEVCTYSYIHYKEEHGIS